MFDNAVFCGEVMMELAMENRDREVYPYMEIVVDAYVHVLYRDRASQDFGTARFGNVEVPDANAEERDAIAD